MGKRIVGLFAGAAFLFFAMIGRLGWLMTGQPQLAQAAAAQSTFLLPVQQGRGLICDRTGQALVNGEERRVAAVLPSAETAEILWEQKPSADFWETRLRQMRPFLLETVGNIEQSAEIRLFSVPVRYGDSACAHHLIGYVDGAGTGQSGIERAYDAQLFAGGETVSVRYTVDALGRAVAGKEEEILREGGKTDGIWLTVDRSLQRICEKALAEAQVSGAVVLMDVYSGEILAMASAPVFDPRDVEAVLQREDSPLLNRALGAWAVGSTFKLITAAAALEEGVLLETVFCCDGWTDVQGQIFRCNDLSGHGELDMEEAVAQSCNCYFIQLAQRIGADPLLAVAKRFGFGQKDVLAQNYLSAAGTLPCAVQLQNPAELANFSFGQGFLTATPVQICKMIAAIASGGEMPSPTVVAGTVKDGRFHAAEEFSANRVISRQTAQQLLSMMTRAVTDGSGQRAQPRSGSCAGKTASAQTGQADEAGEEIVHAWFAGCFPAESPRYALTVFVENGQSGSRTAAPLFARIAEQITAEE